jgi:hypothetical protein
MHWIFAHLIGDYLLQNDWMALNKKNKSFNCLMHVLTYCLPFLLCALAPWQIVLIGIQHFIQDRTNLVVWLMKIKGSGQFASGPCSPWSIIITDNILHVLWIAFVVWLPTFFHAYFCSVPVIF